MSAPYQKSRGAPGRGRARVCRFFLKGGCNNPRCEFLHVHTNPDASGAGAGANAPSAASSIIETMLKLVFEKQHRSIYEPGSGLLNLSRFRELPDLQNVKQSIDFNTSSFCEALSRSIKQLVVPPPSILQFDENQIRSVYHLANAMEKEGLHVSVRALSLAKNNISSLDVAQHLKKFINMEEVVLLENPVTEKKEYRASIRRQLPSLLGLDKEGIAAQPLDIPWPLFYTVAPTTSAEHVPAVGERVYSSAQCGLLQFVQQALLTPLEDAEPSGSSNAGSGMGVDAVSHLYSPKAILTLTLSCPAAAVSSAQVPAGSAVSKPTEVPGTNRNVVRDTVALRMQQTESNHNLTQGIKSKLVACGRTNVCASLERWLYPKNFRVAHFVHDTASAVFLDNMPTLQGQPPSHHSSELGMKVPVALVTIHGIIAWYHRNQPQTNAAEGAVIKRNFTRTMVLTQAANEGGFGAMGGAATPLLPSVGLWFVNNDMVTLYPFTGSTSGGDGCSTVVNATAGGLLHGVRNEIILFSPKTNTQRHERIGRSTRVPPVIVATLSQFVSADLALFTILTDLAHVPLESYEMCATTYTGGDPLAAILLCRITNRFSIPPEKGILLLQQCGLDWMKVVEMIQQGAMNGAS